MLPPVPRRPSAFSPAGGARASARTPRRRREQGGAAAAASPASRLSASSVPACHQLLWWNRPAGRRAGSGARRRVRARGPNSAGRVRAHAAPAGDGDDGWVHCEEGGMWRLRLAPPVRTAGVCVSCARRATGAAAQSSIRRSSATVAISRRSAAFAAAAWVQTRARARPRAAKGAHGPRSFGAGRLRSGSPCSKRHLPGAWPAAGLRWPGLETPRVGAGATAQSAHSAQPTSPPRGSALTPFRVWGSVSRAFAAFTL